MSGNTKRRKTKTAAKVGLGLAAAAAAATAAGAYFFTGKKGAANRKKAKAWAVKAKKEVVKGIHALKKVDQKAYHAVVHGVMKGYDAVKDIDKKEVAALAGELKSHWKNIQKDVAKSSAVKQVKAKIAAGKKILKKKISRK
ncbi:hypothetical protein A3C91_02015 [Candidatus Azambacteria bacterium RIFCSPHIGHO2_02_FULL_52_12]|uniref:Uncharacterized protein n=1 Tax=Candidatus Azambacteria bacterium RIFCSPLOWO2_01_FULL_46_25 TaxID=1797298 RepID=A0A1F5BVH6_9BACT|nr:MAG: hypothetical protein A3C91_02015 [Candidatus Azambacteria bacterium RIFCSPHIGHO2_02_FULL_52_12]OGD34614.1 MAG: hypothetical protein A2988_03875 [Candidatus Azambacteria bacterium RIFCSPLOWO2_01_FULL_46_25]OGD37492.1 MAG: hypothetical protein A2850_03265 [Candidatus Azambacteria bacterium RIFCSPHIGHO2_01_FULL_51_74]